MSLAPRLPGEAAPLVSVVMIFFEAAPYLEEAARSVLDQSWPAVELLLVDDGGQDGSDRLARALHDRDPHRVRLLSHPGRANRGTGPSRLLGIEQARGRFTAFLDADDVWGPEHVAHDVGLLLATPEADMVCGRSRVWRSWAGGPDRLNPLPFAPGAVVEPPRLLAAVLRNGSLATPTCSLLVRTEVLQSLGRDVAAFATTYEDQVINTLLQLRVRAVISAADDAWYRQHPASLYARAKSSGADAAVGPSPDRRQFVRWLAAQPELAPGQVEPDVAALVSAAVAEQEQPAPRSAVRRRAPALLARVHAAPRRRARRWLPQPAGMRSAEAARLTAPWLRSWGEDVHGQVLVVGEVAATAARSCASRVTALHRLEPDRLVTGAPDVPPVDCLVVTELPAAAGAVDALAASLPSRLRRGGRLLLAADAGADDAHLRRLLGPVFGPECLEVHVLEGDGWRAGRVVAARGLRGL